MNCAVHNNRYSANDDVVNLKSIQQGNLWLKFFHHSPIDRQFDGALPRELRGQIRVNLPTFPASVEASGANWQASTSDQFENRADVQQPCQALGSEISLLALW